MATDEIDDKALLAWLNSLTGKFHDGPDVFSFSDLKDGVLLWNLFGNICSEEDQEISNVCFEKCKASSMSELECRFNAITTGLGSFYNCEFDDIREVFLGGGGDDDDVVRDTIQLVLGCAVQGPRRDEIVEKIMSLDYEIQTSIMMAIQGVFSTYRGEEGGNDDDMSTEEEEEEKEEELCFETEMEESCKKDGQKGDEEISFTKAEGKDFEMENANDNENHLKSSPLPKEGKPSSSSSSPSSPSSCPTTTTTLNTLFAASSSEFVHELSSEIDSLRDENAALRQHVAELSKSAATAKQDLLQSKAAQEERETSEQRARLKKQNRAMDEVITRERALLARQEELLDQIKKQESQLSTFYKENNDFQKCKEENQSLRDVVDSLRPQAARCIKLEAQLSKYKERLEDAVDLQRHAQSLEEAVAQHVAENIKLEAQVKTIPTLKQRLSEYKARLTAQEVELSEIKAESARHRKKALDLNSVCQTLDQDRISANLKKEDLELAVQQLTSEAEENALRNLSGVGEGVSELNPVVAEKLKRLNAENVELKSQLNFESKERAESLEVQLDDYKRLKEMFESKYHNESERADLLQEKLTQTTHLFESEKIGRAKDVEDLNLKLEKVKFKNENDMKRMEEMKRRAEEHFHAKYADLHSGILRSDLAHQIRLENTKTKLSEEMENQKIKFLKDIEVEKSNFEMKEKELQSQNSELENSLQTTVHEREKLRGELAAEHEQNQRRRLQVAELEDKSAKQAKRFMSKLKECQELKLRSAAQQQRVRKLTRESSYARKQLQRLKSEGSGSSIREAELDAALDAETTAHRKTRRKLKHLLANGNNGGVSGGGVPSVSSQGYADSMRMMEDELEQMRSEKQTLLLFKAHAMKERHVAESKVAKLERRLEAEQQKAVSLSLKLKRFMKSGENAAASSSIHADEKDDVESTSTTLDKYKKQLKQAKMQIQSSESECKKWHAKAKKYHGQLKAIALRTKLKRQGQASGISKDEKRRVSPKKNNSSKNDEENKDVFNEILQRAKSIDIDEHQKVVKTKQERLHRSLRSARKAAASMSKRQVLSPLQQLSTEAAAVAASENVVSNFASPSQEKTSQIQEKAGKSEEKAQECKQQ